MRKESEREKIIIDSQKKFTILVGKVSNKVWYQEIYEFSANIR
jgi:hypothetical protein